MIMFHRLQALTLKSMHVFSVILPQQPKNAMKSTTQPRPIKTYEKYATNPSENCISIC